MNVAGVHVEHLRQSDCRRKSGDDEVYVADDDVGIHGEKRRQ